MTKTTIEGTILNIFPAEIRGSFESRIIWVRDLDSERYQQDYAIEFHQNDCNLLDNYLIGDHVKCQVDIRGKVYEKFGEAKLFNKLKCWKIELVKRLTNMQQAAAYNDRTHTHDTGYNDMQSQQPVDDLPF